MRLFTRRRPEPSAFAPVWVSEVGLDRGLTIDLATCSQQRLRALLRKSHEWTATLVREPDAVAVHIAGEFIGYVTAEVASAIAPRLDSLRAAGREVLCAVHLDSGGPGVAICLLY